MLSGKKQWLLILWVVLLLKVLSAQDTPYRENYMDTLWTQYGEILEGDCARYGQQVVNIDYNGDSIDDLVVEAGASQFAMGFKKFYFYEGGPAFDNIADYTWYLDITDTTTTYPYWLRNIGDFNGDGFDDLMTVSHFGEYPIYKQFVQVYFCGPDFEFEPDWEYEVTYEPYNNVRYYCLGDINGDGYSDLSYIKSINPVFYNDNRNLMYCIYGDPFEPTVEYFATMGISRDSIANREYNVFPISDINNDSYDDFMVKYYDPDVGHLRNYLFYGSTIPDTLADFSLEVTGGEGFGCGDYNNDGFNDFLGISWNDRKFWYGTNQTLNSEPDLYLANWSMPDGHAYGDLNNDGYDEIIMANRERYLFDGEVYIFVGGTTNSVSYDLSLYTHNMELDWAFGKFGTSIACGDFNNDGYDDIAVGAPDPAGLSSFSSPSYNGHGRVFVFAGNGDLAETDQVGVNSNEVPQPENVTFEVYPNPFNPTVTFEIKFANQQTYQNHTLRVEIYNAKGQKVEEVTVPNTQHQTPNIQITWNAENQPSGIYFSKLVNVATKTELADRKITLLK